MPDITLVIIWISVLLQGATVILALRLIPLTRKAWAWILLSTGFFLMTMRRTLDLLLGENLIEDPVVHQISTRSVALVISLLLFTGVFLIRRVFIQQQEDAEQVRKLSLAVNQSPSATVIFTPDSEIEYVNASYCEMSGSDSSTLAGQTPVFMTTSCTPDSTLQRIWNKISLGSVWRGEVCNTDSEGKMRWAKAVISPIKNENQQITHYIAMLEDITVEKQQRKAIRQLSLHDALTDLPNRGFFNESLQQAIKDGACSNTQLSVMLLDINNFKEINNTLGHLTGDVVLREVSRRLSRVVNSNACHTLARMGGDEFLLFSTNTTEAATLELAEKLSQEITQPLMVENHTLELSVNIGYAFYPQHGESADTLVKHADIAMYAAKSSSNMIVEYEPSLDDGKLKRFELSSHIRKAAEENEFILHYQPQMNISSGEIVGVEALIRWLHPQYGMIPPDEFIKIAETSGTIFIITSWVIEHAIAQLASWQEQGIDLDMAINISASDIQNPELLILLENEIARHRVDPTRIKLEVTEHSLLLYTSQTIDALHYLNEIGIRISIDDFGTGYSSLQYLKNMPLDQIKIDRSFVTNMLQNDNDAVIVRSTIDMAHNLGLVIVAEGIENQETLDILEILRCDYVQGYYLARPMNNATFIEWLNSYQTKITLASAQR